MGEGDEGVATAACFIGTGSFHNTIREAGEEYVFNVPAEQIAPGDAADPQETL